MRDFFFSINDYNYILYFLKYIFKRGNSEKQVVDELIATNHTTNYDISRQLNYSSPWASLNPFLINSL